MFADAATARLDVKKIERPNRELHPRKCGECGVCSTLGSASKGDGNGFSGTTDKNMKAIITTLVAASVSMTSLAGFATEAAAKRKYVYAYAPYAYRPYVVSPLGLHIAHIAVDFRLIPIAMAMALMRVAPLDSYLADTVFMHIALTQIAPQAMAHFSAPTLGGAS